MTRLHFITLVAWALAVLTLQWLLLSCAFKLGYVHAQLDAIDDSLQRAVAAVEAHE